MRTPKPQLLRLQTLIYQGCCLLPCGANKNPLIKAWPSSDGFSLQQIADHPGVKSVGLRTGTEDGRIISVDLDGETAVDKVAEHGLNPFTGTFIVGRRGDTYRLKLQFQLTPEQDAQIGPFQGKIHTKDPINGAKGEAVEIFYSRRRQVIIGGRHPSGENYIWLDGCGPDALSAPDAQWWAFLKECHASSLQPSAAIRRGGTPSRNGRSRRANPCPTCGRHDGPGGSNLWCEYSSSGLLFCMPGSTFSAPAGLRVGDVHNGWALKKITQTADGPVHVFGNHDLDKLKRQNNAQAR
ncbi:bifunctional DNA primase/polymerase [Synechococcus sp. ROS8604]|uniref:bifunctional DNA primase/polymerase n=1 Tax=Synechococcus sp. ROS8604 TaxID=1442557 RepID=UPI00164558C4|nr:bifunctional DNA primase/polymerase [Synechococcus sp. ROS8604]QNI87818.1 hypothetical protein SynROS8604_01176 [Synechococcus sp. ROS8604]